MRNIHECMICKAWVIERFAGNDFIHVAELMNVQEDTGGMTEEKKDNDGKEYHAQVDFLALSPFRTKPLNFFCRCYHIEYDSGVENEK